jgi:hypothetical protein
MWGDSRYPQFLPEARSHLPNVVIHQLAVYKDSACPGASMPRALCGARLVPAQGVSCAGVIMDSWVSFVCVLVCVRSRYIQ